MKKVILILAILALMVPVFAFDSIVSVNAADVVEYKGNPVKFSGDGISYGIDGYVRVWYFRAGLTALRELHPTKTIHGRLGLGFAFDIANTVRLMPSFELSWYMQGRQFRFAEEGENLLKQLTYDTLKVRLDVEVPVNYMTFGLYAGLDTGLSINGISGGTLPSGTIIDNLLLGLRVGVGLY